jgi:phosphatidate cytidylyltransferase
MKRVLTAVVLVPLVLLAVFRAPLWLFALLVAAVIILALHEYLHIAEAAGFKPFTWLTYAVSLLPIVALWIASVHALYFAEPRRYAVYPVDFALLRTLSVLPFLAPVIFGIPLVFRRELRTGLASVAVSAFGVLYVAASLSVLIALRSNPMQCILVIFILLSVWAGDIAAYYVGRSIGKHKLAPIVSPNKSWEGAIASVVASVAVAFLVFHFGQQLNGFFARSWLSGTGGWTLYTPLESLSFHVQPFHVIILGILTNVAAQFGDLFESALKRGANLKDSGALLPGHGGVLDRIDALLFAIPVVWYYANLTGFLSKTFE